MKIGRNHIVGFAGLVVFALGLYWAKAEAQSARENVITLQKEVEAERRAVRTLEAELAYSERPDRLEATARGQLGLVPLAAGQTATLDTLDTIAPLTQAAPIAPNPEIQLKAEATP